MVGITLSPEQVRAAPPEVRRWLEQQLTAAFSLEVSGPAPEAEPPQLAVLNVEEAFTVLSLIRDMIPVVNVFFALGHQGTSLGAGEFVAFRLADIMRQVRLDDPQQIETCLRIVNDAVRRLRHDDHVNFYGLDDRGCCFITAATQRSIARVWQEAVAHHEREIGGTARSGADAQPHGTFSPYPVWTARAQPMAGSVDARFGHGIPALS